jgi:hypothetical protein
MLTGGGGTNASNMSSLASVNTSDEGIHLALNIIITIIFD